MIEHTEHSNHSKVSATNGAAWLPVATRTNRARIISISLAGGVATAAVIGVLYRAHGRDDVPAKQPSVPYLDGAMIVVPDTFRVNAKIATTPVQRALLKPKLEVVGTVTYDPKHVAVVGTRTQGIVSRLMKVEGEDVRRGDVLAEIESAALGEAQADLSIASAHRKAAELNAAREEALSEVRLSTAREAETAHANLEEQNALLRAAEHRVKALGGGDDRTLGSYALKSPLDGTVVERRISAGQTVEGQVAAFQVADLRHLWIELAVFERGIGKINEGDPVSVSPASDITKVIGGKVAHVGDVIDAETRSTTVRVEVDNSERVLRPGQSVTASVLLAEEATEQLVIPIEAMTYVDGVPTVFIEKKPGRFIAVPISLGPVDGKHYAVTKGVHEGDLVAHQGVFALKSEMFR